MDNVSIGVLIKAHGDNTRTCATQAPPDLQGAGTKEPLVTAYIRTWSSQMLLDFYGASLPHKRAILAPIWCATLLHWNPNQSALRLNYRSCVIQVLPDSLGTGCPERDHIQ